MNIVVVSVGSNMDAERSVARAKEFLSAEQKILAQSTFVKTSPIGFSDQADFLNGAFLVSTDMSIDVFKGYLKDLENRLGRVRTENKYGPRIIDLDIAVWNGAIVNNDFYERDFVKKAVMEVLPEIKGQEP